MLGGGRCDATEGDRGGWCGMAGVVGCSCVLPVKVGGSGGGVSVVPEGVVRLVMKVLGWWLWRWCIPSSFCVSTIDYYSAYASVGVGVADLGVDGLDFSCGLHLDVSFWGQGWTVVTQFFVPWWPVASVRGHQSYTVHPPRWCESVLH